IWSPVLAMFGCTRNPTKRALGTRWRSSSTRFGPSAVLSTYVPLLLPPGRLMLLTMPSWTGSLAVAKMMGIVVVAACATRATFVPPPVISTYPPSLLREPATDHSSHRQNEIRLSNCGLRHSQFD